MITINFSGVTSEYKTWFSYHRVLYKNRWTPFMRIRFL